MEKEKSQRNDSEDLLRSRIEERLKGYVNLPNIKCVRDSIAEELKEELNGH